MAATARTSRTPAKPKMPRDRFPPQVRAAMKRRGDAEVVRIDDGPDDTEAERETAFFIGDTEYTMLADPPPSLAMQAIDMAYQRGGTDQAFGVANVFLMREMLGPESYRAFLNSKRMTRAQYRAIIELVTVRAYSALEDEDGNPNS